MRIIVFGARGDVGSRVVAEALARRHEITAVVRRAEQVDSWPKDVEVRVADVDLFPELEAVLASARSAGRVVRGLEDARRALEVDERGLEHVDRRTGVERGRRVSRLVLVSNDGAERFYRNVESLLRRHAPRVLALRISADQSALGGRVFGSDQVARLLMVVHKDAVSALLLALAARWSADERHS